MPEEEIDFLKELNNKLSADGDLSEIGNQNKQGNRYSLIQYEAFRNHLSQNPGLYEKIPKSNNESFIEDLIESDFNKISFFKDFGIVKRQFKNKNKIYDLLIEHKNDNKRIIVELKDSPILPKHLTQIVEYLDSIQDENFKYEGVLIGQSIPSKTKEHYEKYIRDKHDIKFLVFNINIDVEDVKF